MGIIKEKIKAYKANNRFNDTFFGQVPIATKLLGEQVQRFDTIIKRADTETKLKLLFCDHFDIYRGKHHSRKNSLHLANIAVRTLYEYVKDNKR